VRISLHEMEEKDVTKVWQGPDADAISWAQWGDDFVAYHRPSGRTHFLNTASHYLIAELLASPADIDAIASAFAPPTASDDRQAHLEEISAMLEWLDQLGLIRRL
jgi:PqqD family protein of HPr-rel-A system